MWIDPHETGLYLGQCAQYCGTQHAKMLLRVYVQSQEDFERWIQEQQQPAHLKRRCFRGPAHIRNHCLHQLPHRSRHGGRRPLWSRSDSSDEPGHDRRRGRAQHPGESQRWIRKPDCHQARVADARDAIERPRPGRVDCLFGDTSLNTFLIPPNFGQYAKGEYAEENA